MIVLSPQERQVVDAFQRLPPDRRSAVIMEVIGGDSDTWKHYQNAGQKRLRDLAAEQGKNWEQMNDEQRQEFVCAVLNEDPA